MARTKGSKNKPKQEKLEQENSKYRTNNGSNQISIPPFPVTSFAHSTVQTVTVQSKPDVESSVESVQLPSTVEDLALKDILWEAQSPNEENLTEFKDRSALQLAQMVRQGANGSFILGDRHVFKMSVELILEAILLTAR